MLADAMISHGVRQLLNYLDGAIPSSAVDGEVLSAELTDEGRHTDLATISVSDLDKVITPDVVRVRGSQAHTANIV